MIARTTNEVPRMGDDDDDRVLPPVTARHNPLRTFGEVVVRPRAGFEISRDGYRFRGGRGVRPVAPSDGEAMQT